MVIFISIGFALSDAYAVTRYAGLGGSDSNTCAQSQSSATPKLTYASAKSCMSPGDTLRLLAGSTFTELLSLVGLTGTQSAPYTIEVDSGTVTFNTPISSTTCRVLTTSSTSQWITVSGANGNMIWDGSTCGDNLIGGRIENANNITLRNIEIRNFKVSAVYIVSSTDIMLDSMYIHDQVSPTCATGTRYYGIYLRSGTNVTITNSRIHNNPGGGIQIYPGPHTNIVVTENDIADNNACASSPVGGMVIATDSAGGNQTGIVVSRNIIHGNGVVGGGGGIRTYATTFSQTGTQIINNSIYDNLAGSGTGYGIKLDAGPSGTIIRNNHVVGNATGQILDLATGTITSNNRTTGSRTDCTPSASTFTQKSGSACIDAGSTATGLAYNGSAPDIGAFETFVFASCEVPNGAVTTIQITFTSNTNLLGSTLTTFTARRNGSNNALTSAASKIGDTIVSLPLTTTYVGGDTADISWSSGGLTDNALIGGTLNQPFVQTLTNQSCTNNAGGAPSFTLTQATYKFHGVFGLEASPDVRSSEGLSSYSVVAGGAFRIRYSVTCGGADCDPTGFYLYYATGGGYSVIPDTFGAGNIAFCGTTYSDPLIPSNGAATTNQLSTSGTFVPGGVIFSSNAIPTINGLNNGYKTELEYCVKFDTDATGSYTFRLYKQTGTALDTYSATPTVVVVSPQSSGSH